MVDKDHIVSSAFSDPVAVIRDLGGDAADFCMAAGIAPAAMSCAASLPLQRFVALQQISADRLRAPHFGRLVGRRFALSNMGPAGRAAEAAPTLGQALRTMERAFVTVQSGTELRLDVVADEARLTYRIHDMRIWPRDQDAELTLIVFAEMIARCAGRGWRPEALCFEHDDNGADRFRDGALRYAVRHRSATNSLAFPAALLARRMPGDDPARFREAVPAIAEATRRIEAGETLSARVRRLIEAALDGGGADQTEIASRLGVSRRTLRRRLDAAGTGFSEILAECRERRAQALLTRTDLSVAEIAERLGYAEASVFTRAFRTRTGETPAGFRRRAAKRCLQT